MKKEIYNSIWLISGKVSLILGTLVFFSVLSKNVDQEQYGQFTILLLVFSTLGVFCQAGINQCFAKFYNYCRYDRISLVYSCIKIQSTLCIVSLIGVLVYSFEYYSIILLCSILFKPFDIYKSAFDAELNSKKYQRKEIIISIIFSIIKVYYAYLGDLDLICVVFTVERMFVAAMLLYQSKQLSFSYSEKKASSKEILKESLPMLVPSLMYIMYSRIDQAVIYNFLSAIEQAKYFAATQISEGFGFIATSIAISYFSSMTKTKNEENYRENLIAASYAISSVTVPIALFVTFFGKYILVTLFTPEYASSATALSILAWCVVVLGHSSISVKHLIYIGKQRYSTYRALIGVLLNVPLTIFLTGKFGIEGAASATLISQFFALFLSNLLFKETRFLFNIQFKSLIILRVSNEK